MSSIKISVPKHHPPSQGQFDKLEGLIEDLPCYLSIQDAGYSYFEEPEGTQYSVITRGEASELIDYLVVKRDRLREKKRRQVRYIAGAAKEANRPEDLIKQVLGERKPPEVLSIQEAEEVIEKSPEQSYGSDR